MEKQMSRPMCDSFGISTFDMCPTVTSVRMSLSMGACHLGVSASTALSSSSHLSNGKLDEAITQSHKIPTASTANPIAF